MSLIRNIFAYLKHRKKIIFIVEDNRVYGKSLEGFLNTRFPGISIEIFLDGETCLKEMHRNPSVIIMDYLLNTSHTDAATGLAIIKEIKNKSKSTNIILLSAKTDLDVFVKAITLYGCTYLKKDLTAFHKVEQFIKSIFYSEEFLSVR